MSDQVQSTPTRSGLKTGLQLGVIAIAAALAVACGGGGVGSNSTGSAGGFASGTVTGLGSIYVNGIEYDDSNARVLGDDGDDSDGIFSKSNSPVRIGMEVEVESGSVVCTDDPSSTTTPPAQLCKSTATKISYDTELAGPISGLTTTAGVTSFSVLGQAVVLSGSTSFRDVTAAGLADGQVVKVHGRRSTTTPVQITATFIEKKANNVASLPSNFKFRLRGVLTALDTTARTGTIAGEAVTFAAGVDLSTLVVGQPVRVRIAPSATGPWQIDRIKSAKRNFDGRKGREAEIEGSISNIVAAAPGSTVVTFNVNELPVSLDSSTVKFDDGINLDGLVNGAFVEVKGTVNDAGVLVASKVELKSGSGASSPSIKGFIANVDLQAKTFTSSGYTVNYSTASVKQRKNKAALVLSSLANGACIEVQGSFSATDSTLFVATEIKTDDDCHN